MPGPIVVTVQKVIAPAFFLGILLLGACDRTADEKERKEGDGDAVPATPTPQLSPTAVVTPSSSPTAEPTSTVTVEPTPTAAPTPVVVIPEFADIDAKIFQPKCANCHNATVSRGGVDLTSYEKIMNSTVFPPLVIPLNPEKSNIYNVVKTGSMPKGPEKLSQPEISAIEKWIADGAKKNPGDPIPTAAPTPVEPPD